MLRSTTVTLLTMSIATGCNDRPPVPRDERLPDIKRASTPNRPESAPDPEPFTVMQVQSACSSDLSPDCFLAMIRGGCPAISSERDAREFAAEMELESGRSRCDPSYDARILAAATTRTNDDDITTDDIWAISIMFASLCDGKSASDVAFAVATTEMAGNLDSLQYRTKLAEKMGCPRAGYMLADLLADDESAPDYDPDLAEDPPDWDEEEATTMADGAEFQVTWIDTARHVAGCVKEHLTETICSVIVDKMTDSSMISGGGCHALASAVTSRTITPESLANALIDHRSSFTATLSTTQAIYDFGKCAAKAPRPSP